MNINGLHFYDELERGRDNHYDYGPVTRASPMRRAKNFDMELDEVIGEVESALFWAATCESLVFRADRFHRKRLVTLAFKSWLHWLRSRKNMCSSLYYFREHIDTRLLHSCFRAWADVVVETEPTIEHPDDAGCSDLDRLICDVRTAMHLSASIVASFGQPQLGAARILSAKKKSRLFHAWREFALSSRRSLNVLLTRQTRARIIRTWSAWRRCHLHRWREEKRLQAILLTGTARIASSRTRLILSSWRSYTGQLRQQKAIFARFADRRALRLLSGIFFGFRSYVVYNCQLHRSMLMVRLRRARVIARSALEGWIQFVAAKRDALQIVQARTLWRERSTLSSAFQGWLKHCAGRVRQRVLSLAFRHWVEAVAENRRLRLLGKRAVDRILRIRGLAMLSLWRTACARNHSYRLEMERRLAGVASAASRVCHVRLLRSFALWRGAAA
eukprot:Rmarinus@m.21350